MYGDGSAAEPSEAEAVFETMLEEWSRQQGDTGRFESSTLIFREQAVRRFAAFAAAYPWQWSPGHVDGWIDDLMERRRAQLTVRGYRTALRLFCDYLTSPHNRWLTECASRFGRVPAQVVPDGEEARLAGYRGDPARRPMTRKEVQLFLDHADDQVEVALSRGHKGALARYRDAAVFKVIYAWGLRCSEASGLDVLDFHPHADTPELGRFGSLSVRSGRRIRGLPPPRRTVVSLMPWAVEAVEDYLGHVRPRYRGNHQHALWLTERGGRLRTREIEERFAAYRDALDLDKALTPHCMRSAYMAHLLEDGADLTYVQEQVGHRFATTTATCARSAEETA
ncbi:tyrosine-type recombinase/integrase [Nonomuraea diastatica]|uniref:Site-specific integrase n=1 Tax=Nonomuraea diastatica TaxID=1848329 RepID=A0A4R4WF55_9ACTN|nr:tyrosine-type recombinase/integrase [Nonomuraea diastatica]TDD14075.1 site-specific integrase [Nonomuraea diastatica]